MNSFRLLLLLFSLTNTATYADVIKIVGDPFCPYVCVRGDKEGYMIDVARAIFESKGHEVIFENYPWSRAITSVRMGKSAAITSMLPESAPDFVYPAQLGILNPCYFSLEDNPWKYTEISSLTGIRLLLVQDYAYDGEPSLHQFLIKNKGSKNIKYIVGNNPLLQILKMIKNKRGDVLVDDANVINYMLEKHNFSGFKQSGCHRKKPMYLAFSPAHPRFKEYAALFSKGVVELRRSGELKEILNKYAVEDWQ